MKVWATLMLVTSGLFTGGVAVIAWERIPVWRALPLPQFRTDFATTIRIADRVQPALLLASIAATVGFGVTANGAARTFAFVGASGFIVTLVASGAVLVPLQRRIIASMGEEASAIEGMRRDGFSATSGGRRWRWCRSSSWRSWPRYERSRESRHWSRRPLVGQPVDRHARYPRRPRSRIAVRIDAALGPALGRERPRWDRLRRACPLPARHGDRAIGGHDRPAADPRGARRPDTSLVVHRVYVDSPTNGPGRGA